MAKRAKQDTTTGSGTTRTILESGKDPTAAKYQPSPRPTSIEPMSTLPELLSMLQTNCFDLKAVGCKVQLAARKNRLYVILEMPEMGDTVGIEDGHVLLRDRPAVLGESFSCLLYTSPSPRDA